VNVNWATLWIAISGAAVLDTAVAQGIYTCVDSRGRSITSDRPIPECLDRGQKELNSSGTVRRQIGPTLTAMEQAAEEEKTKKAAAEENRRHEEKRKARALLARYPDKAAHDRVRAESLVQIDTHIKTANLQIVELASQRKKLDAEMEFYVSDPAKAPALLKRQVEENDVSVVTQKKFITAQETEKNRVNARFDEDLISLRPMWSASVSTAR
jgi:hypothetical protein